MALTQNPDDLVDFMGRDGDFTWAIGVVEEAGGDPLGLGRVKARWFGYHPEDTSESGVPNKDLPWAQVLRPATNWQMPALAQGDWVMGFFADGKTAQYPFIVGIVNRINRPSNPNHPGNGSTLPRQEPYHGQGQENPEKFTGKNPQPNTPAPNSTTGDSRTHLPVNATGDWTKDHPELKNYGPFSEINQAAYSALLAAEKMSGEKQTITSAYRNPGRNRRVGGAGGSMHLTGKAFDLKPASKKFIQAAVKCGFTGFGTSSYDESSTKSKHIDIGNARTWGPSRRDASTPAWFLRWLREAGWHEGKKPLEGVKTNPGQQKTEDETNQNTTNTGLDDKPAFNQGSVDGTSRDSVRQGIVDSYRAAGYSDAQISGVVAAGYNESKLNPFDSTGDFGTAHGIFQWRGERFDNLQAFAAARGTSWTDAQTQIDFSLKELSQGNRYGGDQLRSAQTPTAAGAAMGRFEKYKNWQGFNRDAALANSLFNGKQIADGTNKPGFQGSTWAQNHMPADTGKPAVSSLARGMSATTTQATPSTPNSSEGGEGVTADMYSGALDSINGYATGTMGGFSRPGGEEPWNEPKSGLVPAHYDMMSVLSTKMHPSAIVVNDVAGAETILLHHGTTGSKYEMLPNGDGVFRTRKNVYHVAGGDAHYGANGDSHFSAKGATKISSNEVNIQSDGSLMVTALNDGKFDISGKMDIQSGENIQFKATRLIVEAQNISMYATENFQIEAGKTISMRAKNITAETSESINVKANKDLNAETKENMSFKATKKLSAQSTEAMNVKSGDKINIQSSAAMNVKSGSTLKVQGTGVGIKGSEYVRLGAPSIEAVGDATLSTPPWVDGGEAPSTADGADDATAAKTVKDPMDKATVVAVKAKSTNLGRPSEKTNMTLDKTQSAGDGSMLSAAQGAYTNNGEA